jgi:O-antigen/teichoic acid export membrane protein
MPLRSQRPASRAVDEQHASGSGQAHDALTVHGVTALYAARAFHGLDGLRYLDLRQGEANDATPADVPSPSPSDGQPGPLGALQAVYLHPSQPEATDATSSAVDEVRRDARVARAPLNVGRRRIVGDIGIQVVARAANLLLGVVVTLIIVRGLGVSGFGVWSTILAIAQMVTTFGDLGLSQVTVSRAAADPEAEADWLGSLLALRLLLSVPICIIELIVMFALAPNDHVKVAGALIASTAVVGAGSSLMAAFQLRVRNDLSMLVMTVNSVLWTGGTAFVAGFTSDIRVYAIVFLISNMVSTALTVALVLKTTPVHLAGVRRLWKEMLRVGVVLGAAGVLVILYVRLDQVLVFKFAGSRQAGLYAAAYRILDQAQFIPGSVMATLFPLIASAYPVDLPRVRRFLRISAEYLSIGSFGALAFTIVVAEPVMVLLFGAQFAPAAAALPVLMGAFVSISFGYLAGSMVVILDLQRRYLLYAAFGLILNVALNLVLIPKYGFKAAAWVTLFTEVTVMSLTMGTVLKRLHMTLSWSRFGRIAPAAAVMGLAVALARHAGVPLGGLVVVAVALYLSLLFASRAVTVHELTSLLRRKPIE